MSDSDCSRSAEVKEGVEGLTAEFLTPEWEADWEAWQETIAAKALGALNSAFFVNGNCLVGDETYALSQAIRAGITDPYVLTVAVRTGGCTPGELDSHLWVWPAQEAGHRVAEEIEDAVAAFDAAQVGTWYLEARANHEKQLRAAFSKLAGEQVEPWATWAEQYTPVQAARNAVETRSFDPWDSGLDDNALLAEDLVEAGTN